MSFGYCHPRQGIRRRPIRRKVKSMKIERDWEAEFGGCAEAVKSLLVSLGHSPVEPVSLRVGMRVRVLAAEEEFTGVIVTLREDSVFADVVINYWSSDLRIMKYKRSQLRPYIT